jgi:hypothetical protein
MILRLGRKVSRSGEEIARISSLVFLTVLVVEARKHASPWREPFTLPPRHSFLTT